MSDAAPRPGWWLASDGKWYPPKEADQPPGPDWWLAADGKWYPPKEADQSPGPGWWLASDGKWYAPEERTPTTGSSTEPETTSAPKSRSRRPARSKAKSGAARGGRRRAAKTEPAAAPAPTSAPRSSAPPAPAAPPPPASGRDRIRPNANEGVSPLDQIERRNQASRADAKVLAAKRAQAASRALGGLESMIAAELAARKVDDVFTEPPASASASAPTPAPAPAPIPEHRGDQQPPEDPASPAADEPSDGSPLLEVKSSALSADLEHLGERLAIFVDRVELRDRLDQVRQSIDGDDIVDVVVQKRVTGAVLTIESVRGPGIAAKGLRPEQAEEARRLIMTKTRPARMASGNGAHAAKPRPAAPAGQPNAATAARPESESGSPANAAAPKLDVAGLRAKLADLRRAGLLTDGEYAQKLERLAQLAKGQALTRSTR